MQRLLAKAERRFGRFAIPNLTNFVVGGMGIVFALSLTKPEFAERLMLEPSRIMHGEVWRLFTYLFIPPSWSPIWILCAIYWTWMVGSALEEEWGALRLNVYYLLGMLGTTVAAFLTGSAIGNTYINLSLFFAFATIFPDFTFRIFFIIPIKAKWSAMLSAAFLVLRFAFGGWGERGAILAVMSNYFLFFGGTLYGIVRSRNVQVRQAARRAEMGSTPPVADQVCAICGAKASEGADIRVCSCDKCKPHRRLCLPHARDH
jgi:membrane associated rhomboid family serine protease